MQPKRRGVDMHLHAPHHIAAGPSARCGRADSQRPSSKRIATPHDLVAAKVILPRKDSFPDDGEQVIHRRPCRALGGTGTRWPAALSLWPSAQRVGVIERAGGLSRPPFPHHFSAMPQPNWGCLLARERPVLRAKEDRRTRLVEKMVGKWWDFRVRGCGHK